MIQMKKDDKYHAIINEAIEYPHGRGGKIKLVSRKKDDLGPVKEVKQERKCLSK